jgi:hypothetical protein
MGFLIKVLIIRENYINKSTPTKPERIIEGKIMKYLMYLLLAFFIQPSMASEISRGNYVHLLLASANGTSTSHFVQWKNSISNGCRENRTKFSFDDEDVMRLLLAAKLANKKVGVIYELTGITSGVPGHGLGACQIVNVWLESE